MEHNINLGIQVIPKSEDKEVYSLVDVAIGVIQNSGLKYRVCPFETVIEGKYGQIMEVVRLAQQACLEAGAEELLVNIRMQIRKDGDVTIEEKTGKYD